jgi:hypothetical protein
MQSRKDTFLTREISVTTGILILCALKTELELRNDFSD